MHDDTVVLKEIRSAFANIQGKGFWPLESLHSVEAYFLCIDGDYGVAVPMDDLPPVDETFSDVRFAVRDFTIMHSGETKSCLSLTSPMPQSQYGDKFILLCYDFLMWVEKDRYVGRIVHIPCCEVHVVQERLIECLIDHQYEFVS